MGFETARGVDGYWRAHLVLDFITYSNPVFGGIPFLSFGEFSDRGNRNRPIGYLQPSSNAKPSVLSFAARPLASRSAGTDRRHDATGDAGFVRVGAGELGNEAESDLHHAVSLQHPELGAAGDPARYHFNWPITQSALYPGAEIVYIDAEDMAYYCGFDLPLLAPQQDTAYRIDLTALFGCVSKRNLFTEPMPSTADIPVTQVLWANESSGVDGALWIDVHDPAMLAAGNPVSPRPATGSGNGTATDAIRRELDRQCQAKPGCADRAALAAAGRQGTLELPIDRQPSRPALLQTVPTAPSSGIRQNP